ncbi:MAG TPA: Ig-like domain repeat protein [Solirubrobacteraceae bacterium]|nr:Ig-like domain repeat protein [Solirubrobacteraceae bacterium]
MLGIFRRALLAGLFLAGGVTGGLVLSTPALAATPTYTTAPSITGTAQQGQTLTLAQQANWTGATSVTDQWQRCAGATCTDIAGQTATTYVVTAADIGDTIQVFETASDGATPTPATANATSNAVGPVTVGAGPTNTALPTISGTPEVGQTLTVAPGSWSGTPTLTHQWQRCAAGTCTNITSATLTTYVVTAADAGDTIQVAETATDPGTGGSTTATSAATPAVPGVPTATTGPAITGVAEQGQTLTEQHGAWTDSPTSYAYQWNRCTAGGLSCTAIPGATLPTYTPSDQDVGYAIDVVETASNSSGSATSTSGPTGVVLARSTIGLLVTPGSAVTNQGVTLAAIVTSSSPNASPSGTLTFTAGGVPISGCASQSVVASGQSTGVSCQTTFPAGNVALRAVYTPGLGSLVAGTTSAASTLTVARASASIALSAPGQVPPSTPVTYSASVQAQIAGARVTPTGTVTFLDRGKPIRSCSGQALHTGIAACQIRYGRRGVHMISAVYNGDGNFVNATSSTSRIDVTPTVLGDVSTLLNWTFYVTRYYSSFRALVAYAMVPGTTARFTCHGGGCPFAKRTVVIKPLRKCGRKHHPSCSKPRNLSLLWLFGHRHLSIGSRITIALLRCGYRGKHYVLTMRSLRGPRSVIKTLPMGVSQKGLRCTAAKRRGR